MDVIVRAAEGCGPDPFLLWDSVWSPELGLADWAVAGRDEKNNVGGLSAKRALFTAVVLCLFTDKRVPADHPLAYLASGDPRGWWGDAVDVRDDLGEADLGSLLWLLERAPLTDDVVRWARAFALEALEPLKGQHAVVRVDAQVAANKPAGRLELTVQLYGRDGSSVFDARFDLVWKQIQG